jgi:hypothetical protein
MKWNFHLWYARNAYKILVRKPGARKLHRIPTRRWKGHMRVKTAQAALLTRKWIPQKMGNFPTICVTTRFSEKTAQWRQNFVLQTVFGASKSSQPNLVKMNYKRRRLHNNCSQHNDIKIPVKLIFYFFIYVIQYCCCKSEISNSNQSSKYSLFIFFTFSLITATQTAETCSCF